MADQERKFVKGVCACKCHCDRALCLWHDFHEETCKHCSGKRRKVAHIAWKEETTGLAIELAGMIIEGIVSNKKKQTFHVSRVAGKLQKIIDKRVAAERKQAFAKCRKVFKQAAFEKPKTASEKRWNALCAVFMRKVELIEKEGNG